MSCDCVINQALRKGIPLKKKYINLALIPNEEKYSHERHNLFMERSNKINQQQVYLQRGIIKITSNGNRH